MMKNYNLRMVLYVILLGSGSMITQAQTPTPTDSTQTIKSGSNQAKKDKPNTAIANRDGKKNSKTVLIPTTDIQDSSLSNRIKMLELDSSKNARLVELLERDIRRYRMDSAQHVKDLKNLESMNERTEKELKELMSYIIQVEGVIEKQYKETAKTRQYLDPQYEPDFDSTRVRNYNSNADLQFQTLTAYYNRLLPLRNSENKEYSQLANEYLEYYTMCKDLFDLYDCFRKTPLTKKDKDSSIENALRNKNFDKPKWKKLSIQRDIYIKRLDDYCSYLNSLYTKTLENKKLCSKNPEGLDVYYGELKPKDIRFYEMRVVYQNQLKKAVRENMPLPTWCQ
jgi:hypothetical protein